MTDDDGLWFLDLLVALSATFAGTAAVWFGVDGPVRVVLTMPLVLLLPGYALVSSLFPERGSLPSNVRTFDEPTHEGRTEESAIGLDGVGRLVLSVLASAALVPMSALAANASPWGLQDRALLIAAAGTTVGLLIVATVRRLLVSPSDRFVLSGSGLRSPLYSMQGHRMDASRWDTTVPNVALLVGLFLLLSSAGYAAANPPDGPSYSEFRVETANMTIDSQQLHPVSFPRGQTTTVDTVVTNHEGGRTEYTVVAVLQSVDRSGDDVSVRNEAVVGRTDATVAAGGQRRVSVDVQPSMGGDDHRLLLLLYRNGAPADPGPGSAYRTLRFDVSLDGGGSGGGDGRVTAPGETTALRGRSAVNGLD